MGDAGHGAAMLVPAERSLSEELTHSGAYDGFDESGYPGVNLYPEQRHHVRQLYQVLLHSPFAIDLSETGTGKTACAATLAQAFRYALVIAPKNVLPKWVGELERCGLAEPDSCLVLTWQAMKLPKHELVEEHIVKGGAQFWTPTEKWRRIVLERRALVIFDEAHKMKNSGTGFSGAAKALLEPILCGDSSRGSRAMLLSATLVDKPEGMFTFMDVLRMLGSDEPHLKAEQRLWDQAERVSPAMPHLLDWCQTHGGTHYTAHADLLQGDPESKQEAWACAVHAWKSTVAQRFARLMVTPGHEFKQVGLSASFPVQSRKEFARIEMASRFASRCTDNGSKEKKESLFKAISEYEMAKVELVARVATQILETTGDSKVVIAASRRDAMAQLQKKLARYGAVELHGDQSAKKREVVRCAFQSSAAASPRAAIGQISVIAAGIDLDDQEGHRPRTTLAVPQYRAIDLSQLMGRTHRRTTRSHSAFALVYAKGAEEPVTTHRNGAALHAKAKVIQEPVASTSARPCWSCCLGMTRQMDR